MSTAEHHLSLLDPSTTILPDHSAPWIDVDAFLRDHAAVTRALQASLSSSSSYSYSSSFTTPHPSPSALLLRRRNLLASGAASKPRRKSRPAPKRPSPITYISADPANFRKMVQWVTGLGSEPPAVEAPTVCAAAMQWNGPSTLDTSAPFVSPAPTARSPVAFDSGPVFPTLESSGVM